MYCRQCGVQLPTNAKFCPKCGTQTTTNGNNVSNGQDTIFWICLFASILLLFIFAIYHTNLIGMTYVDWLFADCSGFSELDDVFDDSNQSFEELCYERKGQGFLISCCLLFLSISTIVSYKSETKKKNSHKNFRTPSERVHERHKNIRRINSDYNLRFSKEDVELYVKQLVNLGYEEDAARQYAIHFYQQNEYIKNNLDPSLTTNRKEVKRPRPAKPSSPPQNRKEVKRPGPSTPPPNRNNKQD
jgi:hypothetical protein